MALLGRLKRQNVSLALLTSGLARPGTALANPCRRDRPLPGLL
jgi:hypothetical protein